MGEGVLLGAPKLVMGPTRPQLDDKTVNKERTNNTWENEYCASINNGRIATTDYQRHAKQGYNASKGIDETMVGCWEGATRSQVVYVT